MIGTISGNYCAYYQIISFRIIRILLESTRYDAVLEQRQWESLQIRNCGAKLNNGLIVIPHSKKLLFLCSCFYHLSTMINYIFNQAEIEFGWKSVVEINEKMEIIRKSRINTFAECQKVYCRSLYQTVFVLDEYCSRQRFFAKLKKL